MTAKTTDIVVRLKGTHPTGSRNRAGFSFSTEPQKISVTEEQLQMIQDDEYLIILKSGTAFEQGLENVGTPIGSDNDETDGKVASDNGQENSDEDEDDSTDEDSQDEENSSGNDEDQQSDDGQKEKSEEIPEKPISRMNKAELIAGLEAKGKVAGTDFEPTASNSVLAELLGSL